MIDRCEGDTANMVRVAWMKNCGGKRGGRAGAPGRGGEGRGSGAWKKLDGASEREGNKSVSGVLAAQ